eukprot:m51a1_g5983 hypothetical protein (881) ;mRNA; r:255994-258849
MGGEGNLKREEAEQRARLISGLSYNLSLTLPGSGDTYSGVLEISFRLAAEHRASTFLDFVSSSSIDHLAVNGHEVPVSESHDSAAHRLVLKEQWLRFGETNTVRVAYVNKYDHDGEGLHVFDDPQDGERYAYTNFEPFGAHKLLPCFDQPSLRGALHLSVAAPPAWLVCANSIELSAAPCGEGMVRHEFRPSPPISTYLFAVIAGPFEKLCDEFASRRGPARVPLGILFRKSMRSAVQADAEELFWLTREGLAFYEDFFAMDYPFSKYDQIFCPEFNQGAMENVGAVTFNERYVFRDRATATQHARRCETVLHEMAHMWFGNLVTPVWWDGLWLNESFASYMSALSQATCAGKYAFFGWIEHNARMKVWAYREDQLSTTHPVHGPVADTNSTFQNFDGITYGKGAALLKQLVFVVGMEGFREGMRYYFNNHKWGNTTIENFIEAINIGAQHASSQRLPANWIDMWLLKAGLNSLHPVIEANAAGVVTSLRVRQTAPEQHPTLRRHHTLVSLYDYRDGRLHLRRSVPVVVLPQPETDIGAQLSVVGEQRPVFVWLNQDDHAYAKVSLDSVSQEFFLEHAGEFPEALLRQQLWATVFNGVRDAQGVSPSEFVHAALRHGPSETEVLSLQFILGNITACIGKYSRYAEVPALALQAYNVAKDIVSKAAAAAPPGEDIDDVAVTWARTAVSWAHYNRQTTESLFELLRSPSCPKWLGDDQSLRWSVVKAASSWNVPGAAEAVAAETKRDPSDRGLREAITCRSSVPDKARKQESWRRFMDPSTKASLYDMGAEMEGFWWSHQREDLREYADHFWKTIRGVYAERKHEFAALFFGNLAPWMPEDEATYHAGKTLLDGLGPEDHVLAHRLRQWIDDVERSRRVMKL